MDEIVILKMFIIISAIGMCISLFNTWLSYTDIYIKIIRIVNWIKFIFMTVTTIILLIILITY